MVLIEGIPFWKAQLVWFTTSFVNLYIVLLSAGLIYSIGWLIGKAIKHANKKK